MCPELGRSPIRLRLYRAVADLYVEEMGLEVKEAK
jgi:hypothetical protein